MLEQDPTKKPRTTSERGRRKKDVDTQASQRRETEIEAAPASEQEQPKSKKRGTKKSAVPDMPHYGVAPSPEERYRMVAEAAYYIAERRGFEGGDPERDWLEAEAQIADLLRPEPRVS